MATTRGEPEPEVTRTERAEAIARIVVAGHEQGAVRRIMLYVLLFIALGVGYWFAPVLVLALVCGVLLLATDPAL